MIADEEPKPLNCKPWPYYIALTADIAKWSDERGLAELILELVYGVADVMEEEAVKIANQRI